MRFQDETVAECTRLVDEWVRARGGDGKEIYRRIVAIEHALCRTARDMSLVAKELKSVQVDAGLFTSLIYLARIGMHPVVIRLLETGALEGSFVRTEDTDNRRGEGDCDESGDPT